jgi:hypothetical protein
MSYFGDFWISLCGFDESYIVYFGIYDKAELNILLAAKGLS